MKIFDTHAHYYDKKFDSIPGGSVELLESKSLRDAVCGIINAGTNFDTSVKCIAEAAKYDFMYCTVGIHPSDAQNICKMSAAEELERIYSLVDTKEKQIKNKIVAIGEIGYDYYWQPVDKKLQYEYFDLQMQLAQGVGLPVVIHDRDAHGDTFDMILRYPNVKGVIHSCSMSAEMAQDLARRGWYISFSGTVTFKNAQKVKEACSAVPCDRLLCETDAPYLAPHPHRGSINNSLLMTYTVSEMAELHSLSYDEMASVLCENTHRIFPLLPKELEN